MSYGVSVVNCSFIGEINTNSVAGGLVGGSFHDADVLIDNSYFIGTINNIQDTEAIAGLAIGTGYHINKSYSVLNLENIFSDIVISPIVVEYKPFFGSYLNTGDNCYYNIELLAEHELTDIKEWQKGRTTEEMTYPADFETTYEDWIFDDTAYNHWSILQSFNNGYPFLNVITPMFISFEGVLELNVMPMATSLEVNLESISAFAQSLDPWFPIIRTNMVSRIDNGAFVSGTLLRTGPYEEALWNYGIKGFFEYIPTSSTFDDFGAKDTFPVRLPVKTTEVTSVKTTQDIAPEDTEIFVESIPAEWQLGSEEVKYLEITDGEKVEKISYSLIEGTTLKEVTRGVLGSTAKNFTVANETVLYTSSLMLSLTWDDEIIPLGKRTEYKVRAAIEVNTELSTTGKSEIFTFYGGEQLVGKDESQPMSDLDLGELFIDARDLETEQELFDRAELKFDEMELEEWNSEEFKEFIWDEFKKPSTLQFGTMTLEELIKIASHITSYTEIDLINNYSREEIEQIIQDKLDIVTVDEINSWDFDVAKLVARLLTGEPFRAYEDWAEREVKDLLIMLLTNDFNFENFENNFPFDKWESLMKSRLELTVNNNASIEVEYNQYGPYNYMIDFNLGDIVVVEYPGVFRAMTRIIEVKEEHTVNEGKKYTLTLGKEFETLIGKLKSDKDSISGRL